MAHIIYLITTYLNSQKYYLESRPIVIVNNKYTCVNCRYQGFDIEICVYNNNFIKLKIDQSPYAICDSIKTFRDEMDKLYTLRYQ